MCSHAGDFLPPCLQSPVHQAGMRHHYLSRTDRRGGFAYTKSGNASTKTQLLSAVSLRLVGQTLFSIPEVLNRALSSQEGAW